ncbi:Protein SOB FIVE-LIKE 5 [Cardamine amara subsp. amara]|uniref:Protein SOB FIVE-LIKE 5 n=1 Tax=Cardamine amara subsp. amara TaxID=228776 RepID=A0ABD1BB87_CARAN
MLGSSSGCESGWTLYLDHSVSSSSQSCFRDINGFEKRGRSKDSWDQSYVRKEEEDDLSMISDASSGPRNISEEDSVKKLNVVGLKKQSKREKKRRNHEKINSVLDDTASSPLFNFPNMLQKSVSGNKIEQTFQESTLNYSQGFSATQFQDKAAFQEHYGYLHMETRS